MDYYAVQVKTGQEAAYIARIKKIAESDIQKAQVYFPQRVLHIRKQGVRKTVQAALFPGYIFLETEDLNPALHWFLRRTPGFYRFLPDSHTPRPLAAEDLSILHHFLSFGEVAHPSKAYFDENDRICIVEGPLKGLEGKIIRVDKRKRRAKIVLDIQQEAFSIDLSFELIQPTDSVPPERK